MLGACLYSPWAVPIATAKESIPVSFTNLTASFGFVYTSNIYFQVLTYETDVGYVFEFNNKKTGVYYDPATITSEGQMIRNPTYDTGFSLYSVQINVFPTGSQKYFRSYKKIQNVIADIGGMLSVIQTIAGVIVNAITGNLIFTHLSKKNHWRFLFLFTKSSIKKL